jgi:hypothetical protein
MAPVDPASVPALAEVEAAPVQAAREERPRRERQPHRDQQPRARRDDAPKGDRPPRAPQEHRGPKPVAAGAERPHAKKDEHRHPKGDRPAKSGGEPRRRRDESPANDDNGTHMPAFLLRPVPGHLLKRKKESEPV